MAGDAVEDFDSSPDGEDSCDLVGELSHQDRVRQEQEGGHRARRRAEKRQEEGVGLKELIPRAASRRRP